MRTLLFLVVLAIFLGANFYVFYRLYQMIPVTFGRIILIIAGVVLVSSFFLVFLAGNHMNPSLISVFYRIGTSWLFILVYFIIIMLLLDVLRITHLLPVENIMYKSWSGFIAVIGVVFLIITWGYVKYENKKRVELNITLNKQTPLGNNLKIVALSDMHLGYGIGRKEFEGWVTFINNENPDLILITGDIIDNNIRPLREQKMEEVFKNIKSTYGIYACLGNHEYISGVEASSSFFQDAGINVLKDSCKLINDQLYIIGRDDRSSGNRKEIKQLLDTLDKTKPVILLDHQPYELEKVAENNIDLQLSGHTHRGQIWPISWITDAIYENSHGLLQKGNSNIYVSSGIGLWGGKFRIGTQSEYVVINLSY